MTIAMAIVVIVVSSLVGGTIAFLLVWGVIVILDRLSERRKRLTGDE